MLADNKQIDKRTIMRNQNRSAALGSLVQRVDNSLKWTMTSFDYRRDFGEKQWTGCMK